MKVITGNTLNLFSILQNALSAGPNLEHATPEASPCSKLCASWPAATRQPILHICPKRQVDRHLRWLRTPSRPVSMPLRRGGPIIQLATARGSVAAQFARDRHPDRPMCRAICRTPAPCACWIASSSRSANDKHRPDNGFDDGAIVDGGMPPAFRNQRAPTGADTPAPIAASSLDSPSAINTQKRRRCSCCATGGRPDELSFPRNARSDRRRPAIQHSSRVLRRPIESA
jgi:hypothetical protein